MEKLVPNLRFSEFKGNWFVKRICDLGLIVTGNTPETSKIEYYNGDHLFVSPVDINDTRWLSNTKTKVTKLGFSKGREIQKNSILFVCIGSTIGKVAQNTASCITNQQINSVIPNDYNSDFVYSLMENHSLKIKQLASEQAVPIINKTVFSNYTLCVTPDKDEQTKIASFLTAVDEKLTLLKKKKDLLEKYKKGVMQKIFNQELRLMDDKGKDFPKWEEKRLGDVSICLDNRRRPLNDAERSGMKGSIPYWGANNIVDYINEYIFDETIVLLAEDGGYFQEFRSRPIANISHGKSWVNNHTHVLKGTENLDNQFLFYSLVHKDITAHVGGGTRSKLTKREMLKIKIEIPCRNEQDKIVNILLALDNKIKLIEQQIGLTETYKKGLLQQMFI